MKTTIGKLRQILREEVKRVVRLRVVDDSAGKLADPIATQNLKINTKNHNAAIKAEHIEYEPLNLSYENY